MVGSGLKKLANEYGMSVDKGVVYGSLRGFAATLSEGYGYKQITFATSFADLANRSRLMDMTNSVDLKKQFGVQKLGIDARRIVVVFRDAAGTMKKISAFLDWFIPLLQEYGASGVNTCVDCGMEITSGKWVLINGIAYYLHDGCAERTKRSIEADNTRRKDEATGSYLLGTLGAFLGSAAGAIVWAVVLYLGYVASIVGLLIGFLAEKGYNLLRGKQGRAKILILILAVIFGVLLGTLAVDVVSLAGMIGNGELPGFSMSDIPLMIWFLLTEDAVYRSATIRNTLMGLFFAALGVFSLLRRAGKEVSDAKYVELK